MMTVQGARRLYECITLTKPSQSKMWSVHWIIGLAYYLAMTMAVWIEGMRMFLFSPRCCIYLGGLEVPSLYVGWH
jgi:hypothetical protein